MSSAKSLNFHHRAGDDEDEDDNNSAASATATAPSNGTPSATSKRKKRSSQPHSKSLLSFAAADGDESPFSRPAPKLSSSRLYKTSAHKLTPSNDRLALHPPHGVKAIVGGSRRGFRLVLGFTVST
ncbi:hypothetical protein Salat_2941200 [Sesamum alatum]|uniref:Uncharacterized protein n=1 Tax=Sesamum alatum TaxID=300844 RepID=A0AAE2C8T1_9LAMI|nr:hypothetical protein Salat_2941200 [Sesamum alatum]